MGGPHLKLWWEPRNQSRAEDACSLARFVNGLPAFDSIYESWIESPETRKDVVPVPLGEAAAARVLDDTVSRYDFGGLWPEHGSDVCAGHAGPPPYDFRNSYTAGTQCHVGQSGPPGAINPNCVFMSLSELRSSTGRPWAASELSPLMKFARDVWNPAEMCAHFSFAPLLLPETPNPNWPGKTRPLRPWIGWITYLPPDLAARARYPQDVDVETLEDGAALVTLCEEPFDRTDAEGMARLHALEAALRPIQR